MAEKAEPPQRSSMAPSKQKWEKMGNAKIFRLPLSFCAMAKWEVLASVEKGKFRLRRENSERNLICRSLKHTRTLGFCKRTAPGVLFFKVAIQSRSMRA